MPLAEKIKTLRLLRYFGNARFFITLCAALLCSGCATFHPTTTVQDLAKTQQSTVASVNQDLEIFVEEFVSSDKSRKAFDTDMPASGVLPVFLRLHNKGSVNYRVDQNDVRAYLDGRMLPPIAGIDAARQAANSDAVSKAAVWTLAAGPFALFFWPATISLSASHTKAINRDIENYFQNSELGKVLIKPGQNAAGFLYFQIPTGVKKLEKLVLEVVATDDVTNTPMTVPLSLPTLELSSIASSPIISNADTQP